MLTTFQFELPRGFSYKPSVVVAHDILRGVSYLVRRHPKWANHLRAEVKCPCFIPNIWTVLLPAKGLRPGLVAHELSHCVSHLMRQLGIVNDETRSQLLDEFTDETFRQLLDHGIVFLHVPPKHESLRPIDLGSFKGRSGWDACQPK